MPAGAQAKGQSPCLVHCHVNPCDATRAYAWSSPAEGSDKRRSFGVLHMGAIKSPVDAVRAAIVAERRAKR